MEFHQLRYFVAAAEELSITAAAKRMHVSQPALSRQIATLEDDLGFPLFDRVRQRIHLTEAGRFFLPKARQILCDAETCVQQLREQFGKAKRTIRLGFLVPFLDDLVAPSVKALRSLSDQVEVSLFELTPRAQLDRLRDGELDLAILGNIDEADLERFGTKLLMKSHMAVVLPDDHKLAGRKQLVLTELAQDSFVSLSNAFFPGRRHFLWSICHSQGFEPDIASECDSLPLLLGAVSSGLGVALLPLHSRKLPHAGCVFVPLKTPVVYAEVLAVYGRESANGAILRLLKELEAAAEAIGDES